MAITRATNRKTQDGHTLTQQEAIFIDKILETGNKAEAYRQAYIYPSSKKDKDGNWIIPKKYETSMKYVGTYANQVFCKPYINKEIKRRQDEIFKANAASAAEVMEFFAAAMRGEIKDQFGLEATLSDRLKAANELAKRTVDLDNRASGKADQVVEIKVDWKR